MVEVLADRQHRRSCRGIKGSHRGDYLYHGRAAERGADSIGGGTPLEQVKITLTHLVAEYASPDHGISVRELAGGYKMATKPEHHESIRHLRQKSAAADEAVAAPALETLAVIAYKQPITAPEILEIRGVQGAGVLKTLLDRKLIATAGRKDVLGKPILYKTTREFLIQFGLSSLDELPTLKEFEELGRGLATDDGEVPRRDRSAGTSRAEERLASRRKRCLKSVCKRFWRMRASPAAVKRKS